MYRSPFDPLKITVLVFWLAFYLYWAISATRVKRDMPGKGSPRNWMLSRLGLLLVVIALYRLAVFSPFLNYASGLSFFRNESVRTIGVLLNALGLLFALWARLHLGRNWSARPTMKIGHELITSGPYRIVRHPIYTGILLAWFGFGLVNGLISMGLFIAFAVIFTSRISREEAYMIELFPDQYPAYRARTKALIPALW
ncbi:MAG TPA: isoprenylcysteine carboxylmethyltransferase family protein [Bryobacteraceae bacterium]|jgi:protein-S-isoprenylcysteine O-methyltransferase Ste14